MAQVLCRRDVLQGSGREKNPLHTPCPVLLRQPCRANLNQDSCLAVAPGISRGRGCRDCGLQGARSHCYLSSIQELRKTGGSRILFSLSHLKKHSSWAGLSQCWYSKLRKFFIKRVFLWTRIFTRILTKWSYSGCLICVNSVRVLKIFFFKVEGMTVIFQRFWRRVEFWWVSWLV